LDERVDNLVSAIGEMLRKRSENPLEMGAD